MYLIIFYEKPFLFPLSVPTPYYYIYLYPLCSIETFFKGLNWSY